MPVFALFAIFMLITVGWNIARLFDPKCTDHALGHVIVAIICGIAFAFNVIHVIVALRGVQS